jgi:hypothetical protein
VLLPYRPTEQLPGAAYAAQNAICYGLKPLFHVKTSPACGRAPGLMLLGTLPSSWLRYAERWQSFALFKVCVLHVLQTLAVGSAPMMILTCLQLLKKHHHTSRAHSRIIHLIVYSTLDIVCQRLAVAQMHFAVRCICMHMHIVLIFDFVSGLRCHLANGFELVLRCFDSRSSPTTATAMITCTPWQGSSSISIDASFHDYFGDVGYIARLPLKGVDTARICPHMPPST